MNMKHLWEKFVIEGDALYDHLVNNYDTLFDGDIIKHFEIRQQYNSLLSGKDIIDQYSIYIDDIKCKLLQWIKTERENGRLFDRNLWKPFRDTYTLNDMYNGYRYLFQYKQFYFQLIMETYCLNDDCALCDDDTLCMNMQHLALTLFTWRDINNIFQLYNEIKILDDNVMPDSFWKRQ